MAAVGPQVGPVVRVVMLGGDGKGFRLCALSGVGPRMIEAERELHLSASRLIAWGPAHPAVELGCGRPGLEPCRLSGAGAHALVVIRVVLVNACDLDAVPVLGGHQGLEQHQFCGAHAHDLIIVQVVLVAACNLEAMPALGGHLGCSRLSMAAVGPLVGPVVRVVVLGGDGGGFCLHAPSGVRPLVITAEGEFHLSASRNLAGSPFCGPLPWHPELTPPAVLLELAVSRMLLGKKARSVRPIFCKLWKSGGGECATH